MVMHKTELKNFAISARRELIEKVALRAKLFGIDEKNGLKIEEKFGQLIVNGETYPLNWRLAFQSLARQLEIKGYQQLIEEVAYTWFNRIIAIRYMELHGYLPERVNVLSSSTGKVEPDILTEFESMDLDVDKDQIKRLIREGDTEQAYRKLFIAQCNALHHILDFLFEKINDYTELLLPDYLLDSESIISKLVKNDALTESFQEVEVIGWLYQYYNTEPKEKVFANLKKNKKIEKYDIPAATQLFTPKWIVQYMVENSLGQLWLEANPNSPLKEKMRYYIEPAEQEEDVKQKLEEIRYKNVNLEEITIIDPCCGSGHILVYAFELLYQMYEEAGYPSGDIPQLILEKNLYGLDIDDRAAQLASFTLLMKGREKSRRILRKKVNLNIYAIQESNQLDSESIARLLGENEKEYFEIKTTIGMFFNAKNLGSIIEPYNLDYGKYLKRIDKLNNDQISIENYHVYDQLNEIKILLNLAKIISSEYDIVVTNPPYMGHSGMNSDLSKYIKEHFPNTKGDLSTVFMEVSLKFAKENGFVSQINIPSWMFLGTYEKLRVNLINNKTFYSLLHLGRGIFGADFGTTSFVIRNCSIKNFIGTYKRLFESQSAVDSLERKKIRFFEEKPYFTKQTNFLKINGTPFTYWAKDIDFKIFTENPKITDVAKAKQGLATGDNNRFLRYWFEVNKSRIGFGYKSSSEAKESNKKWFPYNKGGEFRKWFGNNQYVVNWENDGEEIKNFKDEKGKLRSRPQNTDFYFKEAITWSKVTIGGFSVRYIPNGFLFDVAGCSIFLDENETEKEIYYYLGLLNSKVTRRILQFLSPTVNYEVGHISNIPIKKDDNSRIYSLVKECFGIAKDEWDSKETSWDFKTHSFLKFNKDNNLISMAFDDYRDYRNKQISQMKANEEELNSIFINLYDLQTELTPEVPEEQITMHKANRIDDTKSFLSYFIGCIMGRYSLDVEGLAYAGGEWDESKYQTFKPNKYGLILLTDEYYFEDDIIARLREFLSVTFGEETVEENLQWLAESLEMKRNETAEERLRRYFLDEFFKDHCQVYQKRPIYWLVDSGKQKGLRTLIYMHRYQPDTMATIRFEHLQEIQTKYNNEIDAVNLRITNPNLSATEKRELEKRRERFQKRLEELLEFDKKLAEYANAQIVIDLDDGVKVNYAKFEKVLAKIK